MSGKKAQSGQWAGRPSRAELLSGTLDGGASRRPLSPRPILPTPTPANHEAI